jgi:ribulose-5-phosphate 4-epimerase/fuculose-1-phosphate aldolase
MKQARQISFNIYADTDEEVERGRQAIVKFINIIGQHGAMVSGDRISAAVNLLTKSSFIFSEIIKFFKQ